MTTSQLGKQVKAIHPGAYDHLDDSAVGQALKRKLPGMYDHVTEHEFASTQVNLPATLALAAQAFGKKIPDSHLAKDGREEESHVTVKYGLHNDDPKSVAKALHGEQWASATFGKTSLFSNPEHDVVKVDVGSPDLHRMNGKIAKLPHTDTHPGYKPHMTIAYVKPGLGKKYEGLSIPGLTGHKAQFDSVIFSGKDKARASIPLGIGGSDAGTVPETPKTLQIQLEQLAEGKRRVVFIARGAKVKINPAKYAAQVHKTAAGEFIFNPKLIKRTEIVSAIKEHRLNEILGDAKLGYGAPPKQGLQPPVSAVVSRDPAGETVQGALTDMPHLQQSIAAADAITPAGGNVSVESPQNEIEHRVTSPKSQKFKWRKRSQKIPPGILSTQDGSSLAE